MAEFIVNRGSKVVNEVLRTAWEMEEAKAAQERAAKSRLEILQEARGEPCTCKQASRWHASATELLEHNGISCKSFARAVKELLCKGWGKYRNTMLTGPANCGKTFLLNPLNSIFQTFTNPATTSFAWIGAEEAESFLSFPPYTGLRFYYVAKRIALIKKGNSIQKQLDDTHIRAQTYDGAAAMSSENVGVQKRIREVSPLVMYSHCAGHCLNLVIVHSCKIPLVRNTIDKMKEDKGYDHAQGNWASKTKQDATGLLASITSFDFILSFVTVYVMLSHLDGISKKLQSSSQDIFQAYEMVTEVTQVYRKLRHDVVVHFGRCYAQAVRVTEKIGTTPDMPRITKCQIHRSNTPAATPEEYYRLNLAIPFLDHISNEFEQQFTGLSAKCGKLIGLVPTVLMSEDVEPDFEEVLNTYTDDLPSPELFHHELFRWKLYLSDKFDDNLPSSIAETIKI
ncbi:52 kDa repressor of the inhibitor of the protein kinase [Acropora cervicornis]|uniref:52 kDa repressor of the inhibitor of the protein kinase n=1 Tax=Acropora cervicornis TaxID=6130 RepID=A0AAD9QI87_ACRCE|nr:52 kDa repressor of the inhibitor of the protein kinase [Acropora cervicornis]